KAPYTLVVLLFVQFSKVYYVAISNSLIISGCFSKVKHFLKLFFEHQQLNRDVVSFSATLLVYQALNKLSTFFKMFFSTRSHNRLSPNGQVIIYQQQRLRSTLFCDFFKLFFKDEQNSPLLHFPSVSNPFQRLFQQNQQTSFSLFLILLKARLLAIPPH
uniref:hypothetical protein n=1 Tax=Enterococcus asini TaxID=57732 RepID=UPI00266C8957